MKFNIKFITTYEKLIKPILSGYSNCSIDYALAFYKFCFINYKITNSNSNINAILGITKIEDDIKFKKIENSIFSNTVSRLIEIFTDNEIKLMQYYISNIEYTDQSRKKIHMESIIPYNDFVAIEAILQKFVFSTLEDEDDYCGVNDNYYIDDEERNLAHKFTFMEYIESKLKGLLVENTNFILDVMNECIRIEDQEEAYGITSEEMIPEINNTFCKAINNEITIRQTNSYHYRSNIEFLKQEKYISIKSRNILNFINSDAFNILSESLQKSYKETFYYLRHKSNLYQKSNEDDDDDLFSEYYKMVKIYDDNNCMGSSKLDFGKFNGCEIQTILKNEEGLQYLVWIFINSYFLIFLDQDEDFQYYLKSILIMKNLQQVL
ncbi:MAG: hypothetical protein IPL95_16100 [Saprospiraceae bacterium]|nr:hypothetical protein [Saprospiraceae bacterium]